MIDNDFLFPEQASPEKRREARRKRRDERQKKNNSRKKILSFVWANTEMRSIIATTEPGDGFYERVSEKTRKQQEVLNHVLESLPGSDDLSDKYLMQSGIMASRLVEDGAEDVEQIKAVVDLLSKMNDARTDISDTISSGFFSDDVLVNIKLNLLPATYRFSLLLDDLLADGLTKKEYLGWFNNTIVDMAKDVAFNWDRKSIYRDRETLFVMMLPVCSDIAYDAFIKTLSGQITSSTITDHNAPFDSIFPLTREAIEEADMGYGHHAEYDMHWLKQSLKSILTSSIASLTGSMSQRGLANTLKGYVIDEIDNISAQSWRESSNKLIDKITKETEHLDEEAAEALIVEKYSDPMSIREFETAFRNNLSRWPGPIDALTFDMDLVSKEASRTLSLLWGLSEAACQLRRKQ